MLYYITRPALGSVSFFSRTPGCFLTPAEVLSGFQGIRTQNLWALATRQAPAASITGHS